jgi:hypothetical protein
MRPGTLDGTSWRAITKAPEGWAHSKTLARMAAPPHPRSVLECGGPPPLWPDAQIDPMQTCPSATALQIFYKPLTRA